MPRRFSPRALLCHPRSIHAAAIALVLFACGGSISPSASADGGSTDAPTSDAAAGSDASADGAACATIDPASFDQSCSVDADCVEITAGRFCAGQPWCLCGGVTINASGKARYDSEFQSIESSLKQGPGGCTCPYLGKPRCVSKHCLLCGGAGAQAGCPDGG